MKEVFLRVSLAGSSKSLILSTKISIPNIAHGSIALERKGGRTEEERKGKKDRKRTGRGMERKGKERKKETKGRGEERKGKERKK